MTDEVVALMTKIENEAKRLAASQGWRWDNRHPVYREANDAFMNNDAEALKSIWNDNFC